MPWTDGNSRFTRDFNNEVAFMALTCPKTVVAQYMNINWRTVGNCIKATHERLEPDVSARLRGLKRICVDETSYRKGHKYITIVYDMDRNRVAWIHKGYGLEVFRLFCESLTPEERDSIEVVAGDGAKWIDTCTHDYFKHAKRCVDFFHVVGWVNDQLDKVRNQARANAENDVLRMKKEFKEAEAAEKAEIEKTAKELKAARKELKSLPNRGRPSKRKTELIQYIEMLEKRLKDYKEPKQKTVSEEEYLAAKEELETLPKRGRRSKRKAALLMTIALYEASGKQQDGDLSAVHQKIINDLEKKAKDIQGTKYALGMNPENLSESLADKLRLVEESYPEVYRAYQLKEKLRIILHMKDPITAEIALNKWLAETRESGIHPFEKLAEKIENHKTGILDAIRLQVNSSKSEATNTTIKSLIASARGFRNMQNMFALIYLRCSDIVIPLHNRYQPSVDRQRELRDLQNMRKKLREDAKREAYASQD
jgi:transposase